MAEEKRCWLYTRIDAPEDAHGNLKAQEKMLLDCAAKMGYEVAGTASDLGSGMDMNRAGLARVMEAAKAKDFSVLLITGLDRISRDITKTMDFLTALQLNRVILCTPSDGELGIGDRFRELFGSLPTFPEQDTDDEGMDFDGETEEENMIVLDALPYHGTKICVIFDHGSLRIFDYKAATQGRLTSCEKIAVTDNGVVLNDAVSFSSYQLLSEGKIERRQLPLGYAEQDGQLVADPTEAPIVKRLFELHLLDKFCRPASTVTMEPPVNSEDAWQKASEKFGRDAPEPQMYPKY